MYSQNQFATDSTIRPPAKIFTSAVSVTNCFLQNRLVCKATPLQFVAWCSLRGWILDQDLEAALQVLQGTATDWRTFGGTIAPPPARGRGVIIDIYFVFVKYRKVSALSGCSYSWRGECGSNAWKTLTWFSTDLQHRVGKAGKHECSRGQLRVFFQFLVASILVNCFSSATYFSRNFKLNRKLAELFSMPYA